MQVVRCAWDPKPSSTIISLSDGFAQHTIFPCVSVLHAPYGDKLALKEHHYVKNTCPFRRVARFCRGRRPRAESSIAAPGAKLIKLAGGFEFTEGPAADADGNASTLPTSRTTAS